MLTDVNTQETKAQETVRHETSLADAAKSKRAKRRRIGQLLKRTSRQTMLLKQGSMAPEEANLPNRKEQPCTCADTAERRTVQVDFSARVTLGRLTQEQTPRGKGALAYSTSQHPPTPSGKAGAPLHLVSKQRHLSSACEVPANDTPRKEAPLLVAHTLRKVADLSYKQPDSFEMEEVRWISVHCASNVSPAIFTTCVWVLFFRMESRINYFHKHHAAALWGEGVGFTLLIGVLIILNRLCVRIPSKKVDRFFNQ